LLCSHRESVTEKEQHCIELKTCKKTKNRKYLDKTEKKRKEVAALENREVET